MTKEVQRLQAAEVAEALRSELCLKKGKTIRLHVCAGSLATGHTCQQIFREKRNVLQLVVKLR